MKFLHHSCIIILVSHITCNRIELHSNHPNRPIDTHS